MRSDKPINQWTSPTSTDIEKTQAVFDPNEEMYLYLKAMADAHGGEGAPDAAARLTGDETMAQIVETAIGLEKESILFYIGLKDIVPPELGQEKIDAIIEDKKKHFAQLSGFLKKTPK